MRVQRNVAVLLVLVALTGCTLFGDRARDNVLSPAMVFAGAGIQADALFAAQLAGDTASETTINAFFEKVGNVDNSAVTDWAEVKNLANIGIDSRVQNGEIGPIGAQARRDLLDEYEEALFKLFRLET